MATLTIIKNPFDPYKKEVQVLKSGKPIFEYLLDVDSELELVVSLNGVINEDFNCILKEDDHIAFVVIPAGGGDGNKVLNMVAMVALSIATAGYGAAVAGAMGVTGATGIAVVKAGMMIVGGMLINEIMPMPQPSINTAGKLEEVSPTYAFSAVNANSEGALKPFVFGKRKIKPPLLKYYLNQENDKQFANLMYAINNGEIDNISDIYINDQSLDNYTDVTYETRLGTNNQKSLSNFQSATTSNSINRGLNEKDVEIIHTTAGSDIDEVSIVMVLQKGLFEINSSTGAYEKFILDFQLKYREVGAESWNFKNLNIDTINELEETNDNVTINDMSGGDDGPEYMIRKDRSRWLNYPASSLKVNGKVYGYTKIGGVKYHFKENKKGSWYRYNAQPYILHSEEDLDKFRNQGLIRLDDVYKTTKRLTFNIKNIGRKQLEIAFVRKTKRSDNTKVANDLFIEFINEITHENFIYPSTALLGINALATEQLQGNLPKVECTVENRHLRYIKNNNFFTDETKRLDNPAWACVQALKLANYENEDIDFDEFQEFANFCDELKLKSNFVLDTERSLSEVLDVLSLCGRAKVVQLGHVWKPVIDRKVDIPTTGLLFTSGNILMNSFKTTYLEFDNRANVIEATYYDEKENYKEKTVQVEADDFNSRNKVIKQSLPLYACSSEEQALKHIELYKRKNKYLTETISFSSAINAYTGEVGDVITVGLSYMTNSLYDGRVVYFSKIPPSSTNSILVFNDNKILITNDNKVLLTTDFETNEEGNIPLDKNQVVLDQYITLEADELYEFKYSTSTDDIISIDIEKVDETTTTNIITLNPTQVNFLEDNLKSIPEQYDNFYIGKQDFKGKNLYKIIDTSLSSDYEKSITALEYIPEVYDFTTKVPIQKVENKLGIKNIRIEENLIQKLDGIDEILIISWDGGKLANTIYIDDEKVGSTNTNIFELKNSLIRGKTYTIKINDTELQYEYIGLLKQTEKVEKFNVELDYTNTIITWDKVLFADGYRLYHNDEVIEDKISATSYNYKLLGDGEHTFKIESLNIGDEPSVSVEKKVVVEIPLSPNLNVSYAGENILLEWQESNSTYPIRHYIISHDGLETVSKTTTYKTKVNWLSNQLKIKAVDIAGNISEIRTALSSIEKPVAKNVTSKVVDNNILLYWTLEEKTLPIKEVEIRKGKSFDSSELVGRRVGTFTTLFETLEGYYTYWFTPIDSAGNRGETVSTTAYMSEPPDYKLNVQWYSDFKATKYNAAHVDNVLYLGVKEQTFEEHFTSNMWTSIQDQINSNYPFYFQPTTESSYYEEVFDYETVLDSTSVTVILDHEVFDNASFTIDISVSKDKNSWTEYKNQSKVIENDFRYVKIKINSSGSKKSLLILKQLEVRLDSKLKNDGGNSFSNSTDVDGTLVKFNKDFTDITSLTVTAQGKTARIAIYDFEDVPNPSFFKVLIFNTAGTRINSPFSWSAKGY